ncbi:unnamed protein product [Rhizophagus irregularis]|nr:unnamed protein product [Rhizophagus irregularis]
MFCSIGPSSSGLIFRFQGSKIPALRHFGSLFYRSNSSFLLGPGSLATSDLVLRQFRRFACLSCKKSRFILCITHCSYTILLTNRKTTLKEIVHEIQLRRQIDFHNNIIRFCGIVTENNPKDFFLVMEYADSGTLKNYLKENFKNLTWNDKFDLAFQLVHVVSCLHDEEIVHRNLHSNNILIHQKNIKLANLGLSKRIEEASDPQSIGMIPYVDPKSFTRKRNRDNEIEVYSLNKKSDVYSVGVLLWEISSGRPPFDNEPYDIALAMEIFSGRREIPVSDTPDDYINIYTGCWDIEPDNRQTMRQITSSIKKIEYETIEANDVNCDEMVIDDHENVVVDNDHVEESIEKDVVNEDHNYDEEMAVEEEHEIEVNDDNIKELIELLSSMKIEEEKHKILEYLNEHSII